MKKSLFIIMALLCTLCLSAQPKYIFYFIGDGMGPNQVLAAEMYKAELQGRLGRERLTMTQFPFGGLLSTYSASNGVTDSSAAGTALGLWTEMYQWSAGLDCCGRYAR